MKGEEGEKKKNLEKRDKQGVEENGEPGETINSSPKQHKCDAKDRLLVDPRAHQNTPPTREGKKDYMNGSVLTNGAVPGRINPKFATV